MVSDGLFEESKGLLGGRLEFHRAPAPTDDDVSKLTEKLRRRIIKRFVSLGALTPEKADMMLSWDWSGFSLHAKTSIQAQDRKGLENLLRYCSRPGLRTKRLTYSKEYPMLHTFIVLHFAGHGPGGPNRGESYCAKRHVVADWLAKRQLLCYHPDGTMTTFTRHFDLKKNLARNSFFLFGPRGTGKSYWIKKTLAGVPVFDLLDSDVYDRLMKRPRQLSEEIAFGEKFVVIDEIQKIPRLLDEVHRLIEERKIHFLLTGSSARKLRRGGANMLGGRAWEASFFPLTWSEIPGFDLLKYVNRGGLPKVFLSKFPEEDLKAYTRLYIHEEVKAEALSRNIENFVRFMDVLALSNGLEINYQNLAGDTGVPPRTIENYISVLKDTLMGFELSPFLATKTRKAITRSKFYFFDIGVVNHITKRAPISTGNPAFGDAFEHFIVMETRAFLGLKGKDTPLYFWRTKNGFEVDLVIGNELAVEIESTRQVAPKHLKGLRALKEEGLVKNYAVVSLDPVTRDMAPGIRAIFWPDYLKMLWAGRLV